MSKQITFFYNYLSPYTYLAFTQLPALAAKVDAEIEYVPFDVLEVMRQVNNTPTTLECAVKGQYAKRDLTRWATRYQVHLSPSPYFGAFDPALSHQGAIVAADHGCLSQYNQALFDAVWVKAINLGDIESFIAHLESYGLTNAKQLLEDAAQPSIVTRYHNNNRRAVEAGVFGTPTFAVGGELFFGNDRLDFLEEFLLEQC
jgi:2-hydroxychromene-2-carboxylate isomerase